MGSTNSKQDYSRCQPCIEEDVLTDPSGYCIDCGDAICSNCIKEHRKNRASKEHRLIEIQDDQTRKNLFICLNNVLKCREHTEVMLSHYCLDHKQYICSECLTTSHSGCSKRSETHKETVNAEHAKGLLEKVQNDLANLKEKTERNKIKLGERSVTISTQRKTLVERLHKQIDDLDKKLESETEMLLESELQKLRSDVKECDEMQQFREGLSMLFSCIQDQDIQKKSLLIHEIASKLETMEAKACSCFCKKDLQIVFVEKQTVLNSLGIVKKEVDYEAEMGSTCADDDVDADKTEEHASSCELNRPDNSDNSSKEYKRGNTSEAGNQEISDQHEEMPKCSSSSSNRTADGSGVVVKQEISKKIEKQSSYSKTTVKHTYELTEQYNTPQVIDLVVLENGWLVVADCENDIIEVLDDKGESLYVHSCPAEPVGLCEIEDNHIAVVFRYERKIQRYRVDEYDLEETGHFFSKYTCLDISRRDDNVALMVRDNNDAVVIEIRRWQNGQILRTIDKFTESDGETEIALDDAICLLCHGDDFLIGEVHMLHHFDDDAEQLWFYKKYSTRNRIDKITSLAIDDAANVYVCCSKSENIHKVAFNDYRENEVLLTKCELQEYPSAIAFDKQKKVLYIGFGGSQVIQWYSL